MWRLRRTGNKPLHNCWWRNWILRNTLRRNSNLNTIIFIQDNSFENIVWQMSAIFFTLQYVDHIPSFMSAQVVQPWITTGVGVRLAVLDQYISIKAIFLQTFIGIIFMKTVSADVLVPRGTRPPANAFLTFSLMKLDSVFFAFLCSYFSYRRNLPKWFPIPHAISRYVRA